MRLIHEAQIENRFDTASRVGEHSAALVGAEDDALP
jgi:hypothetical protein